MNNAGIEVKAKLKEEIDVCLQPVAMHRNSLARLYLRPEARFSLILRSLVATHDYARERK